MTLAFQVLSGTIGAEIADVDLARLNSGDFAAIHDAMLEHGILVFRDQNLDPDQLHEFAARWGEVHLHPYLSGLPEHPGIIEIVKEAGERNRFGAHWHTDQIFTPTPAMATMLYAREVPPAGGDTLFASLYHAHDALSDGMRAMLGGLRTYSIYNKERPRSRRMANKVTEREKPAEPAIHPLIRVHPETGRRALYISDTQTTRCLHGMTEAESRPLLDYLLAHATRPEFTCRVRWDVGSLAIWDNRCLLHMALDDYPDHRRVMHRITIKGEAIIGVSDS